MEYVETLRHEAGGPWATSVEAAAALLSADPLAAAVPHRAQLVWDFAVGSAVRRHRPYADRRYWDVVERLLQASASGVRGAGTWGAAAARHARARADGPAFGTAKVKPQLIHSFSNAIEQCTPGTGKSASGGAGAAAGAAAPELLGQLQRCFLLFVEAVPPTFEDAAGILIAVCNLVARTHTMPAMPTAARSTAISGPPGGCGGNGAVEPATSVAQQSLLAVVAAVTTTAYRGHRNPKKAFGMTCTKLLPPLLASSLALSRANSGPAHHPAHHSAAAEEAVAAVLRCVLLAPEHIEFYRAAVLDAPLAAAAAAADDTAAASDDRDSKADPNAEASKKSKKRGKKPANNAELRSYPRQLLESFGMLFSQSDHRASVLLELPRFAAAFLQASKGAYGEVARSVQFSIIKALCTAIGIDVVTDPEGANLATDTLATLGGLLDVVQATRMYNETEDAAKGGRQAKWFTELATVFAKRVTTITGSDHSEQELERLFAALTKLLRLNPSFVEGLLVSLWPTVWSQPTPSTPFAVQVIATFGELRQIDVFLATVFEAARSLAARASSDGYFGFPDEVADGFATVITLLPDGQRMAIWELFIGELQKHVPTTDSPPAKRRKKSKKEKKEKKDRPDVIQGRSGSGGNVDPLQSGAINLTAELFHAFLTHVAVLPHNVQALDKLLTATVDKIIDPLRAGTCAPLAQKAVLLIQFAWSEVSFLVWRVSGHPGTGPRLDLSRVARFDATAEPPNVQYQMYQLQLQALRLTAAKSPCWTCLQSLDGSFEDVLDAIRTSVVTRVCAILEEAIAQDLSLERTALASELLRGLDSSNLESKAKDPTGSTKSKNKGSARTQRASNLLAAAVWCTVASHFTFFIDVCDAAQAQTLANAVVTILQNEIRLSALQGHTASKDTVARKTMGLFQNADFHELPELNQAMLRSSFRSLVLNLQEVGNQCFAGNEAVATGVQALLDQPLGCSAVGLEPALTCRTVDELADNMEVCITLLSSVTISSASEETISEYGLALFQLDKVLFETVGSKVGSKQQSHASEKMVLCWASCRWLVATFATMYPQMLVALLLEPERKFLQYLVKTALKAKPSLGAPAAQCVKSTASILQTFGRNAINNQAYRDGPEAYGATLQAKLVKPARLVRDNIQAYVDGTDTPPFCAGLALMRSLYIGLYAAAKYGKHKAKPAIRGVWSVFRELDALALRQCEAESGMAAPPVIRALAALVQLSTEIGDTDAGAATAPPPRAHKRFLGQALQAVHNSALDSAGDGELSESCLEYVACLLQNAAELPATDFRLILATLISLTAHHQKTASTGSDGAAAPVLPAQLNAALKVAIGACSPEQYTEVLDFLRTEIRGFASSAQAAAAAAAGMSIVVLYDVQRRFAAALLLWQMLLEEASPGSKLALLLQFCSDVVPPLVCVVQATVSDNRGIHPVTFSALQAIWQFLLKSSWTVSATQCGGILHMICSCPHDGFGTEAIATERVAARVQLCSAQFLVMDALLKRHSKPLMSCVATFASFLRTQMACVMGFGAAPMVCDVEAVVKLARSFSRCLVQFSSDANAGKHMPYLVSDFLTVLQSRVLNTQVKAAILPGIHALLGICGEYEKSLIGTVVNEGAKELFRTIYEDFTYHYKYTGKA